MPILRAKRVGAGKRAYAACASARVAFNWTWVRRKVMLQLMDADERDVCLFLKTYPGEFVSFKDISRRAGGKRRYRNEPEWAAPVLAKLVEKCLIESDSTGHYRLKIRTEQEKAKSRWVSPQIRRILEKSGKEFEGIFEVDKDDDELMS
jgi:hypothetical protein